MRWVCVPVLRVTLQGPGAGEPIQKRRTVPWRRATRPAPRTRPHREPRRTAIPGGTDPPRLAQSLQGLCELHGVCAGADTAGVGTAGTVSEREPVTRPVVTELHRRLVRASKNQPAVQLGNEVLGNEVHVNEVHVNEVLGNEVHVNEVQRVRAASTHAGRREAPGHRGSPPSPRVRTDLPPFAQTPWVCASDTGAASACARAWREHGRPAHQLPHGLSAVARA